MRAPSTALRGATPDAARVFRYAAYAFMLTMPWAAVFAGSVNPHDVARMGQSVVMCMAALAIIRLDRPWWPSTPSGRVVLLVVVVFGCLSVATAEKAAYAALEASAMVLLTTVPLVLARTDTETLLSELPAVVALSSLLSVLLELPRLVYFLADARVPQAADFGFMYMSHRFFNHAQSVMLPLAFLPLLVPAPRWARFAAWIGVTGGLALLWRTGGRGTLVALTVFLIVLPWVLRLQVKRVTHTLALAIIGAAVAYVVCFVLPAWLLGLDQDHRGNAATRIAVTTDAGRFYLWKLALEYVLQHPWLGIGPMHYAHQPNLLAAHPHNSVAQWAAEWGLPMTVCMVAVVSMLLARAARRVHAATKPSSVNTLLAIAGLASLVGAIDSLVSGTLVMPVSQMWWFIALGCMLACTFEPRAHQPVSVPIRAAFIAAAIALHIGLSVMTYRHSVRPPEETSSGLQRTNVPRYWINGFF